MSNPKRELLTTHGFAVIDELAVTLAEIDGLTRSLRAARNKRNDQLLHALKVGWGYHGLQERLNVPYSSLCEWIKQGRNT